MIIHVYTYIVYICVHVISCICMYIHICTYIYTYIYIYIYICSGLFQLVEAIAILTVMVDQFVHRRSAQVHACGENAILANMYVHLWARECAALD